MWNSFICETLQRTPANEINDTPHGHQGDDKPQATWDDARLVKECFSGNEETWSALIEKYKALIYSIPIKYRLSEQDASDVFQATCLELLARLPDLRKPRALPRC